MRYTRLKNDRSDGGARALAAAAFALMTVLAPAATASAQGSIATPPPSTTYAAGQGAKLTGLIITRLGDTLIVRNDASLGGGISYVTLNGGTKVYSPSGILNVSRKGQSRDALIPGLIVKVYGSGNPDGNLAADRISFHKSAEKTAAQISAGEVDLRARVMANADSIADAKARGRDAVDALNTRVTDLDKYDVKDRSVVTFETGSAALDESARATLADIVARNRGLSGFIVEVEGFTDSTGPEELNQRLSQQRANAVVNYLTEVSSVPVRRIPISRGLGPTRPVATNDSAEGRAQNRRVEVRVLVNKGLSSSSR
jgi:outer membrane protein OmpA-like peptidoglycan-associated protein